MNLTDVYAPTTKKARIEIIPLIDVIFFLLATFVLFTLSLEKIAAIDVPLPETRAESAESSVLFIQASEGGAYFWKEGSAGTVETIAAAELRPRLDDYKTRVALPRVMVRGDMKASFGAAVHALDVIRAAEIKEVSIETVTSPTGR